MRCLRCWRVQPKVVPYFSQSQLAESARALTDLHVEHAEKKHKEQLAELEAEVKAYKEMVNELRAYKELHNTQIVTVEGHEVVEKEEALEAKNKALEEKLAQVEKKLEQA